MTDAGRAEAVFQVLDILEHPHGGRILRLRLEEGDPPPVDELRSARLRAVSPEGRESIVRVDGFAALGGKPSDERLARTGRVDVRVHGADDGSDAPIGFHWKVVGPLE